MLEVFHLCWNDAVCQEMQADPQRKTLWLLMNDGDAEARRVGRLVCTHGFRGGRGRRTRRNVRMARSFADARA